MAITCRNKCQSGECAAMVNIPVSIAYFKANRCTQCSESNIHFWYLKWVNKCPCCGATLRKKPKKSKSRERFMTPIVQ